MLPIDLVGQGEPRESHHRYSSAPQCHDVLPLCGQPIDCQTADAVGLTVKKGHAIPRIVFAGQVAKAEGLARGGGVAGGRDAMFAGWIVVEPQPTLTDAASLAEKAQIVGGDTAIL